MTNSTKKLKQSSRIFCFDKDHVGVFYKLGKSNANYHKSYFHNLMYMKDLDIECNNVVWRKGYTDKYGIVNSQLYGSGNFKNYNLIRYYNYEVANITNCGTSKINTPCITSKIILYYEGNSSTFAVSYDGKLRYKHTLPDVIKNYYSTILMPIGEKIYLFGYLYNKSDITSHNNFDVYEILVDNKHLKATCLKIKEHRGLPEYDIQSVMRTSTAVQYTGQLKYSENKNFCDKGFVYVTKKQEHNNQYLCSFTVDGGVNENVFELRNDIQYSSQKGFFSYSIASEFYHNGREHLICSYIARGNDDKIVYQCRILYSDDLVSWNYVIVCSLDYAYGSVIGVPSIPIIYKNNILLYSGVISSSNSINYYIGSSITSLQKKTLQGTREINNIQTGEKTQLTITDISQIITTCGKLYVEVNAKNGGKSEFINDVETIMALKNNYAYIIKNYDFEMTEDDKCFEFYHQRNYGEYDFADSFPQDVIYGKYERTNW